MPGREAMRRGGHKDAGFISVRGSVPGTHVTQIEIGAVEAWILVRLC